MSVVIFTGLSRYQDPWHPVAETSAEIAGVVRALGLEPEMRTDESPDALADLSGVDLLIVNSGGGDPDTPIAYDPAWQASFDAVAAYAAAGSPILAVHNAAKAFPEWPAWADIVGTGWIQGTSGHPEISLAVFEADPSAVTHPVFDHLAPISGVTERPAVICYDERYWRLPVRAGNTPLLGHETRGDWYVMGWSRGGSVVVDGLGHDRRSYASVQRRRYLANEIRWLLRDRVALTGNEGAL
ncbi:MAG TPA: ThuA domain-containing protein [Propionibacteriaceae bacterium]